MIVSFHTIEGPVTINTDFIVEIAPFEHGSRADVQACLQTVVGTVHMLTISYEEAHALCTSANSPAA